MADLFSVCVLPKVVRFEQNEGHTGMEPACAIALELT